MKIPETRATRPPVRAKAAKKVSAASDRAGPAPISDKVSIAGIPQDELTPKVREALFALLEEVTMLRSELENARAELTQMRTLADTDPLLGTLNRRAFVERLNHTLALVERYDTPASLVFVDLNDLKVINDRIGHAAGDEALAHVAQILAKNIRQTDHLGRLGGDEFGLLLVMTDEETGKKKAEQLVQAVREVPITLGGAPRRLSIACGVVGLRKSVSAEEALEEADARMYERKKQDKAKRAEARKRA